MRNNRVRISVLSAPALIGDDLSREAWDQSGNPRSQYVEGVAEDVSPVAVEIRTKSGRLFAFPWSNVTAIEYLDER